MTPPAISDAIVVQPGALLATAPAAATVEKLNTTLAPYGLCLPIFPELTNEEHERVCGSVREFFGA